MKTHFYILLMLGMVFLLGCEDEKLGTDLGVTNVVLPIFRKNPWAQRLPFREMALSTVMYWLFLPFQEEPNSPSTWKPEKYNPIISRYFTPLRPPKILMDLYWYAVAKCEH